MLLLHGVLSEMYTLIHGLPQVKSPALDAGASPASVLQSMPTDVPGADTLVLMLEGPQVQLLCFVCCLLQPQVQGKLLASKAGQVRVTVPPTLLRSAVGDANWQQADFKVQLSVHKDGACVAGGLTARLQKWAKTAIGVLRA
jgi:hypothetical protein